MVYTGIFCTLAEVEMKAGVNCSAVSKAEGYVNSYMAQVESFINSQCRYNFSDNYGSLNDDTKGILTECASNMAAIYVIQYDMSNYTSRIEAEDMINVLRDGYLRCLNLLRDKKVSDFIRGEV